ncbi:MAG: YjbH domain-containing protein [Candidatus Azotimanducaceae bacterium]
MLVTPVVTTASDFGTTGLVTIPTARMMEDGDLSTTISRNKVVDIYNISFQVMPRVEATFRYSIFNPRNRDKSSDFNRDRSYEVKVKVAKESTYRPSVAIGIRDLLGTGVWSGEYLVASKRFGSVDATLGLGWGRFSERGGFSNPLRIFSERFESRPGGAVGGVVGGEVRAESFFRGETAFFGGLAYSIPKLPLTAQVQYNSDAYQREVGQGSLARSNPWSLGFNWHVSPAITLGLSYQQQEYFGLTLRSRINFKKNPKRKFDPFYSVADDKGREQAPAWLDLDSWYDNLLFDAERSGLRIYQVSAQPGSKTVGFELANDRYLLTADAVQQFLKLSEVHLPSRFNQIDVLLREGELSAPTISYVRKPKRQKKLQGEGRLDQFSREGLKVLPPRKLLRPSHKTDFGYPKLAVGADLALRVQLMDPNEPLKHQLYVKGTARLALTDVSNVWSAYSLNVSNDFNTKRPSDSVLPRVRSEISQYLTQGETGIDTLFYEHKRSLFGGNYFRAYAGLLEEMFGGVGAEYLFEPFGARWAVGANVNWVKQRGYQKNFSFLDYETVTGHVSAFYASPWYNLDFGIHVGRYLAGDKGVTYESASNLR